MKMYQVLVRFYRTEEDLVSKVRGYYTVLGDLEEGEEVLVDDPEMGLVVGRMYMYIGPEVESMDLIDNPETKFLLVRESEMDNVTLREFVGASTRIGFNRELYNADEQFEKIFKELENLSNKKVK